MPPNNFFAKKNTFNTSGPFTATLLGKMLAKRPAGPRNATLHARRWCSHSFTD